MARKSYTPEQAINKLREVEILISQGAVVTEIIPMPPAKCTPLHVQTVVKPPKFPSNPAPVSPSIAAIVLEKSEPRRFD